MLCRDVVLSCETSTECPLRVLAENLKFASTVECPQSRTVQLRNEGAEPIQVDASVNGPAFTIDGPSSFSMACRWDFAAGNALD